MRGGKGKAGGRKHYWIRTVKYEPHRYRNIGFKPPSSLEPSNDTINIGELETIAFKTFGTEKPKEEHVLDLASLGYDKLLGRGSINTPLKVKVPEYSSRAADKIEAAGGQIVEYE